MECAQQRDAVKYQKFHFRKCLSTSRYFLYTILLVKNLFFLFHNLVKTPQTSCMASVQQTTVQENECEHRLMTINEIINGSVNSRSNQSIQEVKCLLILE